jgi:hypothetical protein
MNKTLILLSAVLLLAGCATTPASEGTRTNDASMSGADDGDNATSADKSKIRCEYEAGTRSRLAERTCHTEEEWERMRKAAQEARARRNSDNDEPTDAKD